MTTPAEVPIPAVGDEAAKIRQLAAHYAKYPKSIYDEMGDLELSSTVRMLLRTDMMHEGICVAARNRIIKLSEELDALARFKAYVHKRLDDAGVPADPDPAATAATGCRIGPRLDHLLAQRDALRAQRPASKVFIPRAYPEEVEI